MHSPREKTFGGIGPAISQAYFEVGQEVYEAFVQKYSLAHKALPHKALSG